MDEVFVVLARLGRIVLHTELKAWHGNVLPDDSSARALALRVKLAREALGIKRRDFYGACGINPKVGEALEAGHASFAFPDREILHDVCSYHNIPEEWLMLGNAEDIEGQNRVCI